MADRRLDELTEATAPEASDLFYLERDPESPPGTPMAIPWSVILDAIPGGGTIRVEDEGSTVVAAATGLNFAGSGVTVTDAGGGEALVTVNTGGINGIRVEDEGSTIIATAVALNFAGAGVVVTDSGSGEALVTISTGGISGVRVEDEGSTVVATGVALNFAGAGVTVTDAGSGEALVTIPGSSFSGDASDVPFTPVPPLLSTDTQAAVQETVSYGDTQLGLHAIDEATHNIPGQIADALGTLKIRQPVRVAATSNVTIATGLNNGDTLDGLTLANGDRVLLTAQSSPAENGIYVVAASPARANDADTAAEVNGAYVLVTAGTNANKWYRQSATVTTIGTDAQTWGDITPAGTGTAPRFVRRTTDATPINSDDTLNNDDQLVLTAVAAGTYVLSSYIGADTASDAANLKMGWVFSGTATMTWTPNGLAIGSNSPAGQIRKDNLDLATSAIVDGGSSAGADVVANPAGLLIVTAPGDLTFQWAQGTSTPAANTRILQNSWVALTKVA